MANKQFTDGNKYVVRVTVKTTKGGRVEHYRYFMNQKEAKAWAKARPGKKDLFRINYDFYGEL
jgi:hypothetical protein